MSDPRSSYCEHCGYGPTCSGACLPPTAESPRRAPREAEAAVATLRRLGYTWCGGVEWKPPLGPKDTVVAFHDKDQPEGIAWCPGFPEALRDITPLYYRGTL
jgi:hypothetical protein